MVSSSFGRKECHFAEEKDPPWNHVDNRRVSSEAATSPVSELVSFSFFLICHHNVEAVLKINIPGVVF